jgi:quercetin dioxygenase-like cupin family protein
MQVIGTPPRSQPGAARSFTGTVWFDPIASGVPPSRLRVYLVHFNPGARTAWHAHRFGQILHVTEGVGRVQARDGNVQEIRAGDAVVIEPGEWHWHGAAADTLMTHLGVHEVADDGSDTEWGEHVTDGEYLAPPWERDRSPG